MLLTQQKEEEMKKFRIGAILVMTVILGLVFTACASKGAKFDVSKSENKTAYDYDRVEAPTQDSGSADNKSKEYGLTSTTDFTAGNIAANQTMDKIITRVNLEVETQEFDDLVSIIKDEIVRLGGYDERTEISGKRYYSSGSSRYGSIVARIPKDKLNEFVDLVKENGNVINETSSSDNVTLEYVDTLSRKKSLEIEQERLWSLLEKTETLEDIVTLESRLSSIRYELQMYETELRTIDNKVDYSTVTISINEVERMTPTTEEKETVFIRIKNGFSKSMFDISEGLKNFFVWFVVNLPYLIMWAVLITVAVIISKKIYKKQRNKNQIVPGIGDRLNDRINKEDSDK
ncbi:MAG: DUF4349 domain-containing protein [Anaerolineaceae bacterium]|nr:MAG: DUF4349 domain-containing protein [Anaerolineaceae bacterium]